MYYANVPGPRKGLAYILALSTALYSSLGAHSALAQQLSNDETVLAPIVVEGATENAGYTVKSTSAATKLTLSPKETPQSMTVVTQERIQDQSLQTVGEVLLNTTGISQRSFDSERFSYYSRGYRINNYMFDGLPTTLGTTGSYLEGTLDTAMYERVEVIRGATGLLTGVGDPSASVNLVRKRATSDVFTATVTGGGGTWDDWRGVADVSMPLVEDGSIRGRFVVSLQDMESQLDRYENNKQLFYGTIDADLGDGTTLSIGFNYQKSDPTNVTWGGLPIWNSAGQKIDWSRSSNVAPDWTYWETVNKGITADLNHEFDNGWEARLVATHGVTEADEKLAGVSGYPDALTGRLRYQGGRFIEHRTVDSLDAYANGPFELLGREHELVIGASASQQRTHSWGATRPYFFVDDVFTFNGSVAEPNWGALTDSGVNRTNQKDVYAATRLNVTNDLKFILGGRLTDWRTQGSSETSEDKFVPYAGVVYDLTDNYAVYASYTGIFNPQTNRDTTGAYLAPLEGVNYEAGVKGAFFDDRLNASLSVFRTEQDNLATADGSNTVPGSGSQAYRTTNGTVSKGFEIELNGALTDRWNVSAGLAHYSLEGPDGIAVNTYIPRTTIHLFTSYTPEVLDDNLTVGGGLRWQNKIYADVTSPTGAQRITQDPYAVFDLFAKYKVSEAVTAQINVNNLFDKIYYSQLGFGNNVGFGPGRSVFASLTYKY
ncbi:ferric-rhodotorulic acid/ferric-coprogen receptor FhuE (plasmid) [Rhizobium sp. CB3060]|uniref:ferric-rhodotorulic acid/ferric-coprogen receptor FhuE n=1 Tax=Rhizobium sp. CB3060 TaxID=3138255 RepID=UPI0021A34F09|nr:ferric-rhodotorulic acid/ferric-coprogen receptor FhuE [Rhizobium tropici]UWU26193.1 ferric-rhodotorulic acid/ferric-coprogen receptor FhuE [Rhizobium tropici]